MLRDCEVRFEILQEYSESGRGSGIMLGTVNVNLAQFVDDGSVERKLVDGDGEDGDGEGDEAFLSAAGSSGGGGGGAADRSDDDVIVRRYLMQDSKINSTLKIGIRMRQIEGDTNFTCPPLKNAMVFGGIAGVLSAQEVTGEQQQSDGQGQASGPIHRTRELSEMQDVYRQTLAASWARAPEDLPPDQLIEDLFGGGDGALPSPASRPSSQTPPTITTSRADDHSPARRHAAPAPDDDFGEVDARRASSSRRHRFLSAGMARRRVDHGKVEPNEDDNSWRNSIHSSDKHRSSRHSYFHNVSHPHDAALTSSASSSSLTSKPSFAHDSSSSSSSSHQYSKDNNNSSSSKNFSSTFPSSSLAVPATTIPANHDMDKERDREKRRVDPTSRTLASSGARGAISELDVRDDLRSWLVEPRVR